MSFKKLIEPLKEAIARNGFEEPLAFQKKILSKIKGGTSMFAIAPTGAGKTTSLVLSVLQKLNAEAFEDAPRALIFVKDKLAALELEEQFNTFKRGTDLRVYSAFEEKKIDHQLDEIYVGVDVVIATPRRLSKLFFLNGINLNKLQLFVVDDAEFLPGTNAFVEVSRIPASLGKCQYLIFANKLDKRFARWQDTFMANAEIIEE
jgi:superfamily II DNA/RNA helicase